MRLLITTQSVDKNDPILGFFHRWIEVFADEYEHIDVVCLRKGEYDLPSNVSVYSLGKENGKNRFKYIFNFYRTLFQLRGKYDAVFSHMNPHYIVLAGLYWKLSRIPMFFWRNHARMNLLTRIAAPLAERVFHTSPFACTARYAHAIQMPVGIDTEMFAPLGERSLNDVRKILILGRLSPVKKVEVLLQAVPLLPQNYEVHVYGDDPSPSKEYATYLKSIASERVFFHGAVKNADTPSIYRAHDVYVNLTPKGSMDKTVLEATACGSTVIVSNESFLGTLDETSYVEDMSPESLASRIVALDTLEDGVKRERVKKVRERVVEMHSLKKLSEKLSHIIQKGV